MKYCCQGIMKTSPKSYEMKSYEMKSYEIVAQEL